VRDRSVTRPGPLDRVRPPPVGTHHDYGRAVLRWLSALVIAVILSAFAVLLLTGRYVNDGPVLVTLGADRGIHAGDVFIVAGWAVALLAEVGLLRAAERRDG
jgi:hypothetical protein